MAPWPDCAGAGLPSATPWPSPPWPSRCRRDAARPPAAVAAKPKPAPRPADADVPVDRSIFRAYDIRGVLGKTLSTGVARQIGRAIGSEAQQRGLKEIAVGRDGRLSGPDLAGALIEGLRSAGCDVIDIGAAPTPVLYFATYHLNIGSGRDGDRKVTIRPSTTASRSCSAGRRWPKALSRICTRASTGAASAAAAVACNPWKSTPTTSSASPAMSRSSTK